MSIHVRLSDGGGCDTSVKVTNNGQLVVAPVEYDLVVFNELAAADTAYNFYTPKPGKQFVITGINAKADRQVSQNTDADVVIYEASSDSTTTVDKTLFQEAMIQGEKATLIPLNIVVNEGKYVNAKTTDDDIYMTIMGYYIDKIK